MSFSPEMRLESQHAPRVKRCQESLTDTVCICLSCLILIDFVLVPLLFPMLAPKARGNRYLYQQFLSFEIGNVGGTLPCQTTGA